MGDIAASWGVTRLAGALGAEVRGPKLAGLDEAGIEAVKSLLHEHLVLFFPDQSPSIEEHIAFGSNFGHLEGHPNLTNIQPLLDNPGLGGGDRVFLHDTNVSCSDVALLIAKGVNVTGILPC